MQVLLEPGLKLIKLFKEYSSKTCILDDFGFYEGRQKTILEKKAKQQYPKQASILGSLVCSCFILYDIFSYLEIVLIFILL